MSFLFSIFVRVYIVNKENQQKEFDSLYEALVLDTKSFGEFSLQSLVVLQLIKKMSYGSPRPYRGGGAGVRRGWNPCRQVFHRDLYQHVPFLAYILNIIW